MKPELLSCIEPVSEIKACFIIFIIFFTEYVSFSYYDTYPQGGEITQEQPL